MKHYTQRLHARIREKGTAALVGIDPRYDLLPPEIRDKAEAKGFGPNQTRAYAFVEFSIRLIDVVAPLVPAVKPQAAFFEELGSTGCLMLEEVISHARKAGLIVICDAKRGDIGSTAEAYARAYLAGEDPTAAPWGADALTVNPYLGADTLRPFVNVCVERGAGMYVLVRTSNPGAGTFQDRVADGKKQFEHVASVVEELAKETAQDGWGCIGAVVGATYPEELKKLRELMPSTPLLIPGYGSQGGTAADVAPGFVDGLGALVNSSRGINFAYRDKKYSERFSPDQWEQATEQATKDMIVDLRAGLQS